LNASALELIGTINIQEGPSILQTNKVMIVSVTEGSFKSTVQTSRYCSPMTRATRLVSYLAFYRSKPLSAVTHYGKVSRVEKNVHYSAYFREKPCWMKAGVQQIKCYHLQWLNELPSPIVRTQKHNAVMRPVYADLETLLSSRNLDALFG